jgi:hypothetical protein
MRVPEPVRRLLLALAPWWHEPVEHERRAKGDAAHIRAIRSREAIEDGVAERYRRQDQVFRQ